MLLRREALLARERADISLISLSEDLADMLSLLRLRSAYIYGAKDKVSFCTNERYTLYTYKDKKQPVREGRRAEDRKNPDPHLPFGLEVRLWVVGG